MQDDAEIRALIPTLNVIIIARQANISIIKARTLRRKVVQFNWTQRR